MLDRGIENVYNKDFLNQKHFITTICREVRNMDPDILFKIKAFYVPNYEYLVKYFGEDITLYKYDCYLPDGSCKWNGHLLIPIRDVKGKVRGFTGYNPLVKLASADDKAKQLPRYKESSQALLNKSRFYLCPFGLEKAINDGYIIITDGVFDALGFAGSGYNSFALLGSNLTEELLFCLSFVETVYVAHDNDKAGLTMYDKIKLKLPNVFYIRQNKCKDMDEFKSKFPVAFEEGMKMITGKFKRSFYINAE